MIDRLVIHIGTHKTGSTAIQRSLVGAREFLLARGILYPKPGRDRLAGHGELARGLTATSGAPTETPTHLAFLEELRDTGASVLVISAEGLGSDFSGRSVAWARAACEELRPREARILAYVRPQWEYMESSYAQRVKDGRTWVTFEEYFERGLGDRRYDYSSVFDPWREALGERLELRPHAPELLMGGDAVTDFWHAAGLGPPPVSRDGFPNRRTGARTTEMLRALRALLADHRLDELLPATKVVRRARERIEAELPGDRPFAPFTPDLVSRVVERFAASNEALVRDYFGGRHASLFSPPTELERSTWSLTEATDQELRVFAGVVGDALRPVRGAARGSAAGYSSGRAPAAVRESVESIRRRLRLRARLGLRG